MTYQVSINAYAKALRQDGKRIAIQYRGARPTGVEIIKGGMNLTIEEFISDDTYQMLIETDLAPLLRGFASKWEPGYYEVEELEEMPKREIESRIEELQHELRRRDLLEQEKIHDAIMKGI